MIVKRLLPIVALVAVLFGTPAALAEDGTEVESSLEISTTSEKTAVETETELEASSEIDVLALLGLTSPLDAVNQWYGLGYCYHDCSPCESRADCVTPSFPYGFPCTEIRLC